MQPVYFDNNATTPLHPRVRAAMLPWFGEQHGNPSSLHRFGQAARNAVEEAREKVAALLGARPPEVVFTASGTEANNAVLFHCFPRGGGRGHLVISAFEHPSIREAAARLEKEGVEVTRVSPAGDGVVPVSEVVRALRPETRLVAEVAAACRERGVPVLCDAVQAVGKIPVSALDLGVDYLVLGAHKFYGPLGAAALWVRKGVELTGYLVGGSQERRRRGGVANAALAAQEEMETRGRHLAALRDHFESGLAQRMPDARFHCQAAPRLPNTSHVAFPGAEGESLLIRLDLAGFAVSTGSACSSGTVEPSKTLLAIGLSPEEALSSLRISFGLFNTAEEVDAFLDAVEREVEALRRVAPVGAQSRGRNHPSPSASRGAAVLAESP